MNINDNSNNNTLLFQFITGKCFHVEIPSNAKCEEVINLVVEKMNLDSKVNLNKNQLRIALQPNLHMKNHEFYKKYQLLSLETAKKTDLKISEHFDCNIVSLMKIAKTPHQVFGWEKIKKNTTQDQKSEQTEEEVIEEYHNRCGCILQ